MNDSNEHFRALVFGEDAVAQLHKFFPEKFIGGRLEFCIGGFFPLKDGTFSDTAYIKEIDLEDLKLIAGYPSVVVLDGVWISKKPDLQQQWDLWVFDLLSMRQDPEIRASIVHLFRR